MKILESTSRSWFIHQQAMHSQVYHVPSFSTPYLLHSGWMNSIGIIPISGIEGVFPILKSRKLVCCRQLGKVIPINFLSLSRRISFPFLLSRYLYKFIKFFYNLNILAKFPFHKTINLSISFSSQLSNSLSEDKKWILRLVW